MLDEDYGKARDDAKNILLYIWKTFDEKTEIIFDNLCKEPLSAVVPVGENSKEIKTEKIIAKLKTVKKELGEEINKIINNEFVDEEDAFIDDDQEWIENRVKNAKKVGINWFQSFIIKSGLSNKDLENIIFLWRNFRNQNLWIRYNKEANFITCRDQGQIIDWLETNDNHLLSCYHEAIFTIVQMRNISEHLGTNRYAKSFLEKLDEPVRDPITGHDKSLFNSYTCFTSIINMITGLMRSLQIFEESIKIALKEDTAESEIPPDIDYNIKCPRCGNEFSIHYEPNEGRKIKCTNCYRRFVFSVGYII